MHRSLGNYDKARADLSHAIQLDPDRTFLFRQRAWVALAKGDFDAAVTDFETAAASEPGGIYNHLGLGVVHYHRGDWTNALRALEEAVVIADAQTEYAEFYRWLCHARAGDRETADRLLSEFAASRSPIEDSDWPGRLTAFLLGDLTEKELFAAASSMGPAEELRCEAFFYAGSLRMLNDEVEKAVEYFRKCLDTKRTDFYEYQSAGAELRELGFLDRN